MYIHDLSARSCESLETIMNSMATRCVFEQSNHRIVKSCVLGYVLCIAFAKLLLCPKNQEGLSEETAQVNSSDDTWVKKKPGLDYLIMTPRHQQS
jgi:hypothetical protein